MANEKSEKKSKDLGKWQQRISISKKRVEKLKKDWRRAIKLYEMHKENPNDVKVPFLFSTFSAQLPALFAVLPKIAALAKTPGDMSNAFVIEQAVMDIAEKAHLYDEVLESVYSSLLLGIGFVKVGYFANTQKTEKTDDELFSEFCDQCPEGKHGDFEKFKKGAISEEIITDDGVFVDYVKASDIFLDPEATKFESCKFIVHRILLSKNEFKSRFGAINIDKTNIKRASMSDDDKKEFGEYLQGADSERYEVFEVWDKPNRRYLVIANGHDDFLVDEPWPFEMSDYPFEAIVLSPKLNSIYGINEILMHETPSKVIDDMTARQEDNAQRVKAILAYEKGAVDDDQLEKLESPGENKVIEVNDVSRIMLMQTPSIPQETYAVKEDMKQQIAETSFISASVNQTAQTATEIQALSQAGNVLTYFKMRRIERFIENIVRKLISLVKQYYDQPKLVRTDDKFSAQPYFRNWTGTDIGEYTFTVRAGSVAYQDTNIRLQQAMQFLGQIMQLQNVLPNPKPLIEELLQRIGDSQGINPQKIRQAFEAPPESRPEQNVVDPTQNQILPPNVPTPEQTAPKIQIPKGLL